MRRPLFLAIGFASLTVLACSSAARGQFEAPPNSLRYEDGGTIEAVEGEIIRVRDSKMESWVLNLMPETKVVVEGEAQTECLRPGLSVQLNVTLNKKGLVTKDVEEIEIFSPQGKASLGFFPVGDDAAARPLRNPGAGEWLVKGKLASFRDRELAITAGSRKIVAKTAADLKVSLKLDDVNLAQQGDEIKIVAWYYERNRPNPMLMRWGRALAEEVTITLAKPLAPTGKKIRPQSDKATKSAKTSR